jgi:hypothetical protein
LPNAIFLDGVKEIIGDPAHTSVAHHPFESPYYSIMDEPQLSYQGSTFITYLSCKPSYFPSHYLGKHLYKWVSIISKYNRNVSGYYVSRYTTWWLPDRECTGMVGTELTTLVIYGTGI